MKKYVKVVVSGSEPTENYHLTLQGFTKSTGKKKNRDEKINK